MEKDLFKKVLGVEIEPEVELNLKVLDIQKTGTEKKIIPTGEGKSFGEIKKYIKSNYKKIFSFEFVWEKLSEEITEELETIIGESTKLLLKNDLEDGFLTGYEKTKIYNLSKLSQGEKNKLCSLLIKYDSRIELCTDHLETDQGIRIN